jgi:hypothetical protein
LVKSEQIKRIERMEGLFDALSQPDPREIRQNPALLEMLDELITYYEQGQWQADYRADEHGLLPKDLKRGVLSEDGVWNLLSAIDNPTCRGYNRSSEQKEENP